MFRERCSPVDGPSTAEGWRDALMFITGRITSITEMQGPWLASQTLCSLTDFEPLCKWCCYLRRTFLSGLQFYRSWYFSTLLLENFPFLILAFVGFPFEVGEQGTGLRSHVRIVSLLSFVPTCECECVSELVHFFEGLECGITLARILDWVPGHVTLKQALQLQTQLRPPNGIKSFGNYMPVVTWTARSGRPQSGLALPVLAV